MEEHAQEERLATVLQRLDEREEDRIGDIDAALARIEAGVYGRCENCGRPIEEDRLRAIPTTTLCVVCSGQREDQSQNESEDIPQTGPLPPDLDGLADEDLQEHLFQLVRENGQVDTDELQIVARRGGGLFGKSRAERHRMLLSIDRRRGNSGNCRPFGDSATRMGAQ